jgi:MT0933-like antitoxin protein
VRCRDACSDTVGRKQLLQKGARGDVGISDRLKNLRKKAEDTAAEHEDQIKAAVEKAEGMADQRTEGKYHDQIAKAGAKVDDYVQNLNAQGGEGAEESGPSESSASPREQDPDTH